MQSETRGTNKTRLRPRVLLRSHSVLPQWLLLLVLRHVPRFQTHFLLLLLWSRSITVHRSYRGSNVQGNRFYTQPNLLERRSHWNERTPEEFALPTEIWRETIERLQR